MKKVFFIILICILVFLLSLFIFIFSSSGNKFLSSYIEDKAKKDFNVNLDITNFNLSPSKLDANLKIEDYLNLNLSGKINLFSLYVNIDYILGYDFSKINKKVVKDNVFNGKIEGKISDLYISGKGFLFGSDANLKTRIYDYFPIDLSLKADGIDLDYLYPLLKIEKIINARIFLDSNISSKDFKPYGKFIAKTYIDNFDDKFLLNQYGLKFPKDFKPEIKLDSNISGDILDFDLISNSAYLNLKAYKSYYDLKKKELNSNFYIDIPNLASLKSFVDSNLNGKLNLDGNINIKENKISNFVANIIGIGGDVKITFKDNKFKAFANNVKLENILSLTKNKEFASGLIDANVSFDGFDFKKLKGDLALKNGKINSKLLDSEFGISYPNLDFELISKINSDDNTIFFNNDLKNDLLKIDIFKGSYDLNNNQIKLNLKAKSNNFAKYKEFSNINNMDLDFYFNGSKTINNLKLNLILDNGKLNTKIAKSNMQLKSENLSIDKLLTLLGQKQYASGILNAKLDLDNLNLKDLSGEYEINSKGEIKKEIINKFMDKNLPTNLSYDLNSKGDIVNNIVSFNARISSNILNIEKFVGKFDINNIKLKSDYIINAYDFSKLGFLIDKKLRGNAVFNGKISYDKNLNLNINSNNLFNGKLIADLKNSSKIEANLTNFDLSSLMNSFYVLDIYKANGNMELSYDLSKNTGFANLNLLDGGFKKSPIINAISLVLGKDLTRDSFQTAKMNANINKENIDFNLDMKSNYSDINIKNANVNTNSGYLNIPFSANIDKIDFKGRIKGTMENPKVNIDARSVLKTIKNIFGKKEEEKPKEKIDKLLKKIF